MKAMASGNMSPSGKWRHSFEEDQPGVEVYRPADSFAFPPARRGRETLDFGGTGALTIGAPGPDDRSRETSGSWTALGMNRFRLDGGNQSSRTIEVIENSPDILKIRAL
jgi:hypothetical protein